MQHISWLHVVREVSLIGFRVVVFLKSCVIDVLIEAFLFLFFFNSTGLNLKCALT